MAILADTGARTFFEGGGLKELTPEKGRWDLLPLDIIADYTHDVIINRIDKYIRSGSIGFLWSAIAIFISENYSSFYEALKVVAIHYKDGAEKYGDRNWENGLPISIYLSSGIHHYYRHKEGMTDEPHDRAFLWNMLAVIWTQQHKPEFIDLPTRRVEDENKNKQSITRLDECSQQMQNHCGEGLSQPTEQSKFSKEDTYCRTLTD